MDTSLSKFTENYPALWNLSFSTSYCVEKYLLIKLCNLSLFYWAFVYPKYFFIAYDKKNVFQGKNVSYSLMLLHPCSAHLKNSRVLLGRKEKKNAMPYLLKLKGRLYRRLGSRTPQFHFLKTRPSRYYCQNIRLMSGDTSLWRDKNDLHLFLDKIILENRSMRSAILSTSWPLTVNPPIVCVIL